MAAIVAKAAEGSVPTESLVQSAYRDGVEAGECRQSTSAQIKRSVLYLVSIYQVFPMQKYI